MMRIIKKYKNRRLYDTQISQYITIEALRDYVVQGVEFSVLDSTTEQDITTITLLQILVEMETSSAQFLSPEILRQLINLAHHPMNQSLRSMLEQTMSFVDGQMKANSYINDLQKASETLNQKGKQFLSEWQNLFKK